MHISSEHDKQMIVSYNDLSGGLNLTNASEMIQPTELARAVNVEPDATTGLLKTCGGLKKIADGENLWSLIYDSINNSILAISWDRTQNKLYKLVGDAFVELGTVAGAGSVVTYANWEDGVIFSVGGALNYWNGTTLTAIENDFTTDKDIYWEEVTPVAWAVSTAYVVDDIVSYKDKLYKCITAHTSSAGTTTTYDEATPLYIDKAYWKRASVPEWIHNHSYAIDDVVTAGGKVYICRVRHTSCPNTREVSNSFSTDGGYWSDIGSIEDNWGYHYDSWAHNTRYSQGRIVQYGNKYYWCKTDHTSCAKTSTVANTFSYDERYWVEYDVPAWEHEHAYNVNALMKYEDVIYKCKQTHISCASAPLVSITGGLVETDSANWQEVNGSAWQYSHTYYKGDLIYVDDVLYRCTGYHCSCGLAPTECQGVFVKDGRVWVAIRDELHCSAIGDEKGWAVNDNDISAAQWLQIGYKDGGVITGVVALAQDTVIFKSNKHAYRLMGQFPDWTVVEIGRAIENKGFNTCIALQSSVLALGNEDIQAISANETYADMMAQNIATKVSPELRFYDAKTKVRYVPALSQVWFILGGDEKQFLFMDAVHGGFYHREYNDAITDVLSVDSSVLVLKRDGVYLIDSDSMMDNGDEMKWIIQCKSLASNNDYLTKRVRIDTTIMFDNYAAHNYKIGKLNLEGSVPKSAQALYNDSTKIFHNSRPIFIEGGSQNIYESSEEIYDNPDEIYENITTFLKSLSMYRVDKRVVDRNKDIKVVARGAGGQLLIDNISFEIVEV